MLLENKIAIVTGGSRGIGYATVEAFIKEGSRVVLCASRQETAQTAVDKLKEAYADAAVEGIWPDLSDYSAVKEAFDAVVEKYGRIDILVNNAGVSESTPFVDYTEEKFEKVMDLNVKGVFNCSKAASGGERRDPQYLFHGEYLRTAGGNRLSDLEICSQRIHPVSGQRTGAEGGARKRGSARYHIYGHDACRAERSDRTHDRPGSAAAYGAA